MADDDKKVKVTQTVNGGHLIPFTGGICFIYAFFWPESFAHWWGTIAGIIIRTVRDLGGL